MFCKNCGAQINDNATFCPNCGTPVGNSAPADQQPAADQQQAPVQQAPVQQTAAPAGTAPKSKMVAGLLGIFLGGFGIHNFYLGFTKRALIQLLVSLLTCGIGVLPMEIWGLIEGIFYLTGREGYTADAQGVALID